MDLSPLQNPMDLPPEFKSWLVKYLELNPPNLPVKQMLGYKDGPRVTTSAISGGPPTTPDDGDIWIATGVDGNGTRWQFQYNAGSSSAYKWEFIGGAPVIVVVDAQEGTTAQWPTVVDLATPGPNYNVVRAGDYAYSAVMRAYGSVAGGAPVIEVAWYQQPSGPWHADTLQGVTTSSGASQTEMMTVLGKLTGVVAGSPLRVLYSGLNGGTNTYLQRRLAVTPIRIS